MRILVTGAAGFIGSHVASDLIDLGHKVLTIDNFSFGKPEFVPAGVEVVNLDLGTCDEDVLVAELKKFDPEAVVHLAAIHFIPYCMEHPTQTFQANVRGTEILVRTVQQTSARKIVFASTMDVYPAVDKIHAETDEPAPYNIYGLSKWLGENILSCAARVNDQISAVSLRFSNAIGPRETNPHLVPDVLDRVGDKDLLEIRMGYLGAERDFVDVRDVASAVVAALLNDTGRYNVFNIGSGVSTPVRRVVELIKEYAGDSRPIIEDEKKFRKFDRNTLSPDISKLKSVLHWVPNWTLDRTIRELVGKKMA